MSQTAPPLGVRVHAQPNDFVCGPTSLHAVYRYFRHEKTLQQVIDEIPTLPLEGGTLAVQLGRHALGEGFSATIYTNNLQSFDPTWFRAGVDLQAKLRAQQSKKSDPKLHIATEAYVDFLTLGGSIRLGFNIDLIRTYIDRRIPILAGLSATYLYDCPREQPDGAFDDEGGNPTGHFVVIHGYDVDTDHVQIADPYQDNPAFKDRYYSVDIHRLLTSILLGIVTYDANLLVIEPKP